MTENFFGCSCGFRCVESQVAKTMGACPKCGRRSVAMRTKYAEENFEQTDIHMTSRKVN